MKKTITIGLYFGPFAHADFVKVELPVWLFWLIYIAAALLMLIFYTLLKN